MRAPAQRMQPFEVDEHWSEGALTLSLRGELDHVSAPLVDAALERGRADGAVLLVLDLAGLTFLDSSGIRSLLNAALAADAEGPPLTIVPAPPQVQSRFTIAHLEDRLPFAAPPGPGGLDPSPPHAAAPPPPAVPEREPPDRSPGDGAAR